MMEQNMNQLDLKFVLEREQNELFNRTKSEFWQTLFCDILKKHTYQNDFFFVENNLTSENVVESLKAVFYDICHNYGQEYKVTSHSYRTELKLKFDYYDYNNEEHRLLLDRLTLNTHWCDYYGWHMGIVGVLGIGIANGLFYNNHRVR